MNNLTDQQRAFFKAANDLLKVGANMRLAQKGYSKTRDPRVQKEMKKLESRFDKSLRELDKHKDTYGQMTLELFKSID